MAATEKLTVRLMHRCSIPQARWCAPLNWEPANEIDGAEYLNGSWWSEHQEEAGVVCFTAGEENEVVNVQPDDLRIASCGDCRIIGRVEL